MRFGIAVPVEKAAIIKKLGYDYFEPGFATVANMTEDEYKAFCDAVANCGILPEAMNLMLPGKTYPLVGENIDLTAVGEFLERGFERVSKIGTKTVVFGSGGARSVPDGFAREKAYDQIEDYLKLAGGIAAKNGCTVSIEPLFYGGCNIINTVSEAAYVAARVNLPSVRILGDYYHMGLNKEDCECFPAYAHRLEHMHLGRHVTRFYSFIGDGCDYEPFFGNLKKAGYDKRVSLEGNFEDFERDAERSLELLKSFE